MTASAARLLDAYLVTVAEHGFNASTFAARVTASTGADLSAAVVSGVATLSGPLHGGAPGPVLDMLDAVGSPERARRTSARSWRLGGASWAWGIACTACAIRARSCWSGL